MRLPSNPDALENKPSTSGSVSRDPSYPDRARIDSDVRAFLRPVSTPWIVFDRDSRVDDFAKSALRVGAVFASSPSFRPEVIQAAEAIGKSVEEVANMPLPLPPLDSAAPVTAPAAEAPAAPGAPAAPVAQQPLVREDAFRAGAVLAPAMSSVLPNNGVFPVSVSSPESAVEPSNLVVARDVMHDSSSIALHDDARLGIGSDPFVTPPGLPKRGRVAMIAGACAGVLALVGATVFVLSGGVRSQATASVTAPAVEMAAAPAMAAAPSPAETLELDSIPPPPSTIAEAAPATTPGTPAEAAPATTPEPARSKIPTDPKKRFGKLTIKSDAKYKNVWFDGKRMLGNGQRSFLVYCGMHTIAVADKTDAKDIEVPCNGEYVVSR